MASEGTLPAGHWLWGITRSMSEQVCVLSSMELTMQVRELVQRASTDAIAR